MPDFSGDRPVAKAEGLNRAMAAIRLLVSQDRARAAPTVLADKGAALRLPQIAYHWRHEAFLSRLDTAPYDPGTPISFVNPSASKWFPGFSLAR